VSLPDGLAILRALAGIPILIALGSDRRDIALGIFVVAALSDALDGWLARRSGKVTAHGALLDPLADKALVVLTLAALSLSGAVPLGLAAAVAVRELLVSGLRVLRYRGGQHIHASLAAKLKTALEMCGIAILIVARPSSSEATIGVALLVASLVIGIVTMPTYLMSPSQVTKQS
jgi:CDP-diacylglycerol--glycerol-3-phosphate 3-phosphatidyltransferase